MQPMALCGQPAPIEAPVIEPRFWRITYGELVAMWGEQGALRMLRAMERAFEQQVPAVDNEQRTPCFESGQAVLHR